MVRDTAILVLLAVVAVALAWPTLHMGLWLDEYLSVNSSSAPDVVTMVKSCFGRQDDYHPPLAYVLLHSWMTVFGKGDVAVKVPFLLCGIATIPALYWLGYTAHSARVGLLAAFFFVVSPLANFLTCQCRGYALAILLSTLCLAFFIHLQRDLTTAKGPMPMPVAFAGVAITAAALCYTEYVGCVLIPCLGLATVLICLREFLRNQDHASRRQAINKFVRCVGSLFAAFALFAPWIPSVLNQAHGALYMDRTPLSRFPEVFYWNVMNLLPTHIGLGIFLLIAIAAIAVRQHFINKRNRSDSFFIAETPVSSRFSSTDIYIILWCATVIPCCAMGYITNWWQGYFRYIYPYAPAAWTLLAAAFYAVFWGKEITLKQSAKFGLIAFLALLSAINITWIIYYSQIPNSGLRVVAKEAQLGKFDNTAFLIVPEVIGPTLGYYLTEDDRKAHNIGIFGFAKWDDPIIPMYIPDIAKGWVSDSLVADTENRIAELPAKGFKFLALAKDSDKQIETLSSERMPRKKRLAELLVALSQKYKLVSTKHYAAHTEDVTVMIYDLRN